MSPELKELKARRTQADADTATRTAYLRAAHLQKRRDTLISGEWWPSDHHCDECLQAILDMAPDDVCEDGKRYKWW